MAKAQAVSAEEYLQALEHPLKDVVLALRTRVLEVDAEISEHIKWNSLAFYFNGEMQDFDPKTYKRDILVLHLRKPGEVLLVFPTGSVVDDPSGFLSETYTDGRRMAVLRSMDELQSNAEHLRQVLKGWLSVVER